MKNEKIKKIYLNWKGLEFLYSLKCYLKWIIVILSIIFIFISLKIQNYYILGGSLILIFLQLLSESKKDYFLKYESLFEKLKKSKENKSDKEWLDFLENTSALNSIQRWFFNIFLSKKFKKEIEEGV